MLVFESDTFPCHNFLLKRFWNVALETYMYSVYVLSRGSAVLGLESRDFLTLKQKCYFIIRELECNLVSN